MDSPESKTTPVSNNKNKLINPSSSSDSPAFQDSPVFNYISNLSPIQPVKAGPVAQGFPGLASPPLVFTSPRIYSQTSFFSRKLQSSGSNTEVPQDHEKCQKNARDLDDSVKRDPGFHSLLPRTDQKACNTEKLQQIVHCSPSGCFDDFVAHSEPCAKSSQDKQSDDAPPSLKGGVLEKKDDGDGKDVGLDASALQKGKESVQSKSRISVKLVKNEARHLLSSSECSGALPRLLMDHTSEIFQSGDSFSEASHFERGSLRRCLFDESQRKISAVRSDFRKPISSPQLLESDDKCAEKSGSRQMINLSKHTIDEHISSATGNYPIAIPKPLGIGLHLNSVIYPRSTDSVISSQQLSVVKVEMKSSLFVANNQSDAKVNASNVSGKAPSRSEEIDQRQACLLPTSDNVIPSDAVEQFHNAMELEVKLDASSTISNEKRKLSSDDAEIDESSLVAVSPKKKRKRDPSSNGNETNKRCNCRKTKCLKLYCDCFAAGFYCGESCACQGCFNKPEYEDTVLETRQQIESRNPLAFAPKIVQPVTGSPAIVEEVGNLSTPSSARHKRGCNCKKSMCLKKYCECYQANVGCSEGCRCEGCKNIYGIREDFSIAREIMIKRASLETSEGTMVNSDLVSSRAHNSPNLMPITPALLCSDQKNNAIKSRLPFRRFLQSSDSHCDILKSGENVGSPRIPQNHNMLLEKIKFTDVGALEAEKASDYAADRVVPAGDDSIFAPCSSQLSNIDAIDSNLRNVPQPESIAESGPLPPSNSLRWRSSPITPITQLAASELKDFASNSKQSDVLEDETPEILKHSPNPDKSVKVSSPNKKRISPPHNHMISSESLRCSRKFVLRAVPSFPSLTPYSKNSSNEMRGQSS